MIFGTVILQMQDKFKDDAKKVCVFAEFVSRLYNGVTLKKYLGPILKWVIKCAKGDAVAQYALVDYDEYYFMRSLNMIRNKFGNLDYFTFIFGVFVAFDQKLDVKWIFEHIYKESLKDFGPMIVLKQYFDKDWHEFEAERYRLNHPKKRKE